MLSDDDVRAWESSIRKLLAAGFRVSADPQVARQIAKSHRALYVALIDEGFSKSDALKIVAGSRLPEFKA